MDPQAAKHSIPEENPASTDNRVSIKRLFKPGRDSRKAVVITKCLCEPCSIFYTDTISGSIFIECRDPRHTFDGDARDRNDR